MGRGCPRATGGRCSFPLQKDPILSWAAKLKNLSPRESLGHQGKEARESHCGTGNVRHAAKWRPFALERVAVMLRLMPRGSSWGKDELREFLARM